MIAALVAGGAVLGTGIVLFATAPSANAKKPPTTGELSLVARPTGVSLAGRF
jgi:hypothetical protein